MINLFDLTIAYRKKKAIANLNLTINKGESVLLAGANGSGKTTLLRAVAGVLLPKTGEILVNDERVGYRTRRKTAYIPSSISFYDSLKVKEAIKLHGSFYPGFAYQGIGGYRFDVNQGVGTLSRGEKTLFFLSLSLSTSPDYLLIDDVIHLLDPHLREIFIQSILQLIEAEKMAVVIAAQSAFDIEGLVERVVLLDKGRVFLDEPVEDLKGKFVKMYSQVAREDLPVVFSRDWQGMKELYLYPFMPGVKTGAEVEHLSLTEILRAFIGGEYVNR